MLSRPVAQTAANQMLNRRISVKPEHGHSDSCLYGSEFQFKTNSTDFKMRPDRDHLNMTKLIMRFYPDLIAAICGLLIIPWIIGIPGQPTQTILSGWTLGLIAIGGYLVIYQCVKSFKASARYKKNASLQQPVTAILNMSALCLMPAMLIALLLLFYVE